MVYLKKLMAAVALLATAHAAHASLIVNGGFEDLDIDTLSPRPYLLSGAPWGRPGNISLHLPSGASIPGWTAEGTGAALMNNNIGSGVVGGAYWPTAYDGEQYLYLNNWGNNSTSLYQTLGLTGGNQYSLEFFLNGLTGSGAYFDGLPYQPQVLVSILDDLLNPVFQSLVTGVSNTAWTEIDLDFSVLNSGTYRLVFSTPSNPVLPEGQDQNFITLDNISLLEALQPEPEPEPQPQPVPAPATLWCMLAAIIGLRLTQRHSQSRF